MSDYSLMSLAPKRSGNFPLPVPDSAGIPKSVRDDMIIAPFNDAEAVADLVREHRSDLAGVIVEPFQRIIPPAPGFLQALRRITQENGVPLIFDEVVTGFRLAYGGAQEYYGVVPDLCTLGKVIGGGFPLAAIAGKAEIMAHFDKGKVGDENFLVQIGTLSGNPVAAAAGLATMAILKRPGAYERIHATGRELMGALGELLNEAGIPAQISGEPPLFDVVFTDQPVRDYRSTLAGRRRSDAPLQRVVARARHPEGRVEILHLARPHPRGYRLYDRRLEIGDQGIEGPDLSGMILAGGNAMNRKDSEDLVRVGPGTVMGELMRQYWIPAAMSSELKADGAPMRLMLLGEQLIAFRDSSGRVGVMDHRCPHRCASLFLGRNEENGIRCVYHGWKFDADGNCVDMPNLAGNPDFKNRIKAKAYKVSGAQRPGLGLYGQARGGAAAAGDRGDVAARKRGEDLVCAARVQLAAGAGRRHRHLAFRLSARRLVDAGDVPEDSLFRYTVANRAPEYHVTDTDSGTMYAAYRPAEPGRTYWRFANFMLPFWTQTPQGKFTEHLHNRAWVPMDDNHTMFVSLTWRQHPPSIGPDKQAACCPAFSAIRLSAEHDRLVRPLAARAGTRTTG